MQQKTPYKDSTLSFIGSQSAVTTIILASDCKTIHKFLKLRIKAIIRYC